MLLGASLDVHLTVNENGYVTTRYETRNVRVGEVKEYLELAIESLQSELAELKECKIRHE